MANGKYIITVSREFGSLGRPIAEEAAKRLGIEYYDRDIVEMTSTSMNVDTDTIDFHDEARYGRFERMAYPLGAGNNPVDQEQLYEIQKSIILDLANNKSPCLIVGRCSDYILRDYDNAMHVFIYAAYENRLATCISDFNMTSKEAKKKITAVDRARSSYYQFHTGLPFDTRQGRDLLLDSGFYGVEGSVELLVTAAKVHFGL